MVFPQKKDQSNFTSITLVLFDQSNKTSFPYLFSAGTFDYKVQRDVEFSPVILQSKASTL